MKKALLGIVVLLASGSSFASDVCIVSIASGSEIHCDGKDVSDDYPAATFGDEGSESALLQKLITQGYTLTTQVAGGAHDSFVLVKK